MGLWYYFCMEAIAVVLATLLSFLLKLLELFIGFIIQILSLVLDFARSIVGLTG